VSATAEPVNVNLQYEVMDGTRDAERFVWGTVTLQIQDVPDPVTGVAVTSFGDGSLTVQWNPGGFNNAPITGYTVTTTKPDGSVFGTTQCTVTSGCVVRTPGNGPANRVRLSVTAHNSVGDSLPASLGADVWSDVLPDAPSISDAKATNVAPGAVSVSWPAVPDPQGASAITQYVVRITGTDTDSTSTVPATGAPTYTFTSTLTPARQYQVVVYAQNSAQVLSSSDWRRSAASTVTPVGFPGKPGTVSAVVVNQSGDIRVTWGSSDPNGAPADSVSYSVGRFTAGDAAPGTCQKPTPGSGGNVASGWTDTAVADGGNYYYVVYADNGYFCTPTASGQVLTKQTPGQARGTIELAPNGQSGQLDIRITNPTTSGAKYPDTVYQYKLGGGAWKAIPDDGWVTSMADSSVYGNPTTVTLRACRDGGFCGDPSEAKTLTPVNARAAIASCIPGQDVRPAPPVNAGTPQISYQYSYQGALPGIWSAYSPNAAAPADATAVRVKASVQFPPDPQFEDPGFGEESCTP
jgi:large repetitive protein